MGVVARENPERRLIAYAIFSRVDSDENPRTRRFARSFGASAKR
jgi:hypothetical protein